MARRAEDKVMQRILYAETRSYLWALLFILFLVIAGVGLQALSPLAFKVIIDNVLGNEKFAPQSWAERLLGWLSTREGLGFFIILVYCLINVASNLFEYFANLLTKRVSRNVVQSFANKAFTNLEKLDIAYYKKQDLGDYLYRLSYDVSAVGNLLEDGLLPLVTNLLYISFSLVILFFINAQLAWLATAIIPVFALGLLAFNRSIDATTEHSEHSNSLFFSFVEQALYQLKIVQAFNQQKQQSDLFNQKIEIALADEYTVFGLGFLLNATIGIVIALGYALVLFLGIKAVFIGALSTGLLIVFIFYLDNLTYPLVNFLTALTTLREQFTKVERLSDFFTSDLRLPDRGTLTTVTEPEIVFSGVTLYGSDQTLILDNISLKIPANQTTAIVGVSGSGKTTIAHLILRFMDPNKGTIQIGGKAIQDYSLFGLRENIAYVPQEVVLFSESIKKNILFGNSQADTRAVAAAAHAAAAQSFIDQLPGEYSFAVGEEGLNLSGGQRQRVLLARAFLRQQAKILILDEPVSFLDIKTRAEVIKHLKAYSHNRTVIIISNILEIIDQADHVILINEGRVIHQGKVSSLDEVSHLSHLILRS